MYWQEEVAPEEMRQRYDRIVSVTIFSTNAIMTRMPTTTLCVCTQVGASVRNLVTDSVHFWDLDTVRNRVGLMHEMFHTALRGELLRATSAEGLVDDPFYDPHMLQVCFYTTVTLHVYHTDGFIDS